MHFLPGQVLTTTLLLLLSSGAAAADAAAASSDARARIVESSLKDLSAANDAAIARQRLEPGRATDALGDSRVVLQPEPLPPVDQRVSQDVQSSLHRLRRETVSRQTEDGRKVRVEEGLERAAEPQR